jgi:hypothetical protein
MKASKLVLPAAFEITKIFRLKKQVPLTTFLIILVQLHHRDILDLKYSKEYLFLYFLLQNSQDYHEIITPTPIHAAIIPETIPPPFEVLSFLTFAIFLILIVLNNFF